MEYAGRYKVFDYSQIRTYPLAERPNVLKLEQLLWPDDTRGAAERWCTPELEHVVAAIKDARARDRAVILFMGAHSIKLGHSRLYVDLMRKGLVTLLATNGAGSIHDFELALIGETSESVPNALPKGLFGMAEETGRCMHEALQAGDREKLGYGESMGRMIMTGWPRGTDCPHRDISVIGQAYDLGVPATVHATIGTDIIDQHPIFDGAAKGGTSGRDLAIFAQEVTRLRDGGVILNIGSAVTGPEVLLKTVSMAANIGMPPMGLVTANFDLRTGSPEDIRDPSQHKFYFREIKSTVTRIPQAFEGRGYMVAGNFLDSIPALHDLLTR
jgi:hypothetical protein